MPEPMFISRGVRLSAALKVIKERHLRVTVEDVADGKSFGGMAWAGERTGRQWRGRVDGSGETCSTLRIGCGGIGIRILGDGSWRLWGCAGDRRRGMTRMSFAGGIQDAQNF